jgi:hypothetical protein
MSIASLPVGEAPISAQPPGGGPKKAPNRPPANRKLVAKTDTVALPEPR